MKTKKFTFVILLFWMGASMAQENKASVITQTFMVMGNCGQCKERIESSLDKKGIKYAEWNKKTRQLKVVYKPSVITPEEIIKLILEAGHDLDTLKASEEAYRKLPECCKYRHVKPH